MRRRQRPSPALNRSFLLLLFVIAFVSPLGFSLAGYAQVAGPGSDNPKNLPGQPLPPPDTPPRTAPITDPQVNVVMDQMAAAGVLHPTTLEQWRKAYLFYAKLAGPPEKVLRVEDGKIPGRSGDIRYRLYAASTGIALPVWVFFHGGGFVTGSLDTPDVTLRAIANRCDCLIVSVAYRLAPANPFPAATDDAYAATKWIAEHAAEIGGDPNRLAVGGDGAGGNLAAVVALMARDRNGPSLVYQLLIYPILDLTMLTDSRVLSSDPILTNDAALATTSVYVPVNTDLENPYISPVYEKNLSHLPAALILTGANDPGRDEADRYASELREGGVSAALSRYPNAIHGFFLMAGALDAGKKSIDEIAAALKQAFKNTKAGGQNAWPR